MTEKGKNKKAILVLILLVILLAAIGLVEYGIICKNIEKKRKNLKTKKQGLCVRKIRLNEQGKNES